MSLPVDYTEEMVFHPPEGMEGWRYYRIEYGGPNKACLTEGGVWLPSWADAQRIVDLINEMQEEN